MLDISPYLLLDQDHSRPPAVRPRTFYNPHAYEAALLARGFERIGFGGVGPRPDSSVLAKPGSDAVVKVGLFCADDPWPLYAEWAFHNPGRFAPHVRSLHWHGLGLGRFYVASMDRLQRNPDGGPLTRAVLNFYSELQKIAARIDRSDPPTGLIADMLARALSREALPSVAAFVSDLHARFPKFVFDPHPGNWMRARDARLVLIDPFVRSALGVPHTFARLPASPARR